MSNHVDVSTRSPEIKSSGTKKEKELEIKKQSSKRDMVIALEKGVNIMYNDNLTDLQIDIMRSKIQKKEANEKVLAEEAARKAALKKSAASKKNEQNFNLDAMSSYTFDDKGQLL